MDIFIIKTTDINELKTNLLLEFQKKDISNEQKLKIHCLSYLMLDRILHEVYKLNNREIIFTNGKPSLKSGLKHFSISHSGDFIALGFSNSNCGVDIEKNTARNLKKIATRMHFNSNKPEDFYPQWTKFEATYKLNETLMSAKTFQINEYTLTAVSNNPQETFELFLQSN